MTIVQSIAPESLSYPQRMRLIEKVRKALPHLIFISVLDYGGNGFAVVIKPPEPEEVLQPIIDEFIDEREYIFIRR